MLKKSVPSCNNTKTNKNTAYDGILCIVRVCSCRRCSASVLTKDDALVMVDPVAVVRLGGRVLLLLLLFCWLCCPLRCAFLSVSACLSSGDCCNPCVLLTQYIRMGIVHFQRILSSPFFRCHLVLLLLHFRPEVGGPLTAQRMSDTIANQSCDTQSAQKNRSGSGGQQCTTPEVHKVTKEPMTHRASRQILSRSTTNEPTARERKTGLNCNQRCGSVRSGPLFRPIPRSQDSARARCGEFTVPGVTSKVPEDTAINRQ